MAVELDASKDFLAILDHGQALILQRQGTSVNVAIDGARRFESLYWPTEQSNGTAQVHDTIWQFVWEDLSDLPRIGDLITDAVGNCWTVQKIEQLEANTRLRVFARDLQIECWLSSRVDIEEAEWEDLGGGPEIVGWKTIFSAVTARIQPARTVGIDATEEQSATSTALFDVILGEQLSLDHNHRIVDTDGAVYKFVQQTQSERIDRLPVIRVERE